MSSTGDKQTSPSPALNDSGAVPRRRFLIATGLLFLVTLAAYHNTFQHPFIFDDIASIQDNTSIRQWGTALAPDMKNGETASGRPVLNLSFALNYKISGAGVWSYHAGNLLIHWLAGLALLGIVRRTLLLPGLRERFGDAAFMLGWLAAAIWLVHPLATESVTYMVQRVESLMALFYLLTLYGFIRAATNINFQKRLDFPNGGTASVPSASPRDGRHGGRPSKGQNTKENWYKVWNDARCESASIDSRPSQIVNYLWLGVSWLSCLAGMATKEVMVSAPVMIVLYDAAFIAGSIREALRRRWRRHAAHALTWIPLALLVASAGGRGGTVGFSADSEITWWPYALTQCWAFVRYLHLSFIPHPLVFDYGLFVYARALEVWWQMLFVLVFVAACFLLYWKRPRAGWLGLFYLAALAPTTTVIPVVTQVVAEHRMYLPLTAVVASVVLAGYHFLSRRVLWAGIPVVALFAVMTFERNKVYVDDDTLWTDVVRKYPVSARANGNYGNMLVRLGRAGEGLPYLEKAVALHPSRGDHYNNLGHAHAAIGNYEKAIYYYEQAGGRKVSREDIFYTNYCQALLKLRRFDEAMTVGRRLLAADPGGTAALVIMGNVHFAKNNLAGAEECFKKALEIDDKNPEAWNNRGNIKALEGGKLEEALEYYKKAAALAPASADIQDNVARLLSQLGRWQEAIPYFEAELAAGPPDDGPARLGHADALYAAKRHAEAAAQYKLCLEKDLGQQRHVGGRVAALMAQGDTEAARLLAQAMVDAVPGNPANRFLLANILVALGRGGDGLPHYEEALRADPSRTSVRYNYAVALTQCGRYAEAIEHYEEALKSDPGQALLRLGYSIALEKLGRIQDAVAQAREALRLQPGLQEARQHLERLSRLEAR
jgi:tetratricopeptide (TPR) repeat protein